MRGCITNFKSRKFFYQREHFKRKAEHLHKCSNVLKLKLFPKKEDAVFFFTLFSLFNLINWSLLALQSTIHHINVLCNGKYLLKSFIDCGTDSNSIKISCHSRLFFVLQLLVTSVIVMAIARKAVERVFILIQFFSYLRKQGWLFTCSPVHDSDKK